MGGCKLPSFLVMILSVMILAAAPGGADAAGRDTAAGKNGRQTGTELDVNEPPIMSSGERSDLQQGRSEPGAGDPMPGRIVKQPSGGQRPVPQAGWLTYVHPSHGFRIDYPAGFAARPQDVSRLAHFTPTPVVSVFFMNPTMAAGALAGIEPPDLEVRVYEAGRVDSLQKWLVAVGFASVDNAATARPYQNAQVSGLKVCQSTMLAPGCSVYILHGGRVYQLTPLSREGEAMTESFALLR